MSNGAIIEERVIFINTYLLQLHAFKYLVRNIVDNKSVFYKMILYV